MKRMAESWPKQAANFGVPRFRFGADDYPLRTESVRLGGRWMANWRTVWGSAINRFGILKAHTPAEPPLAIVSGWVRAWRWAFKVLSVNRTGGTMQFKQAKKILLEIIRTPHIPTNVALASIRLLFRNDLPKLGPYTKRSAEQSLWRLASGCTFSPESRLKALRKLLAINASLVKHSAQILVSHGPGGK